jgi:hypothetical protein
MLTRPLLLLKLEDACLFVATLALYHHLHSSWLLFGILFLAPDLFMFGYRLNARVGSALYNVGHFLLIPLVFFATALVFHHPTLAAIALIWMAHIFFDRLLGFGLKYPTQFKDTHLQHI